MKVVWVNQSFLDYRVPVYKHLNTLLGNNLYVLYSKTLTPERVHAKITNALGYNAIPVSFEKFVKWGDDKSDFANTSYLISFPSDILKHLKKIGPDMIIGEGFFKWTPYALVYSVMKGKKLFISYERTKYTERSCPKHREMYRRIVAKYSAGFFVNGIQTFEYCTDVLKIQSDKIVTKCMSAGDCKTTINKELCGSDITKFLFVGRLVKRKGLHEFIKSLANLKDSIRKRIQINIIGSGPELNVLSDFSRDRGLDFINFLGEVDHDNMSDYYLHSDVFFLPTLEDNWSLVIPEAMAHGMPVATTPYNGCHPELIHHRKNGFLFDCYDSQSVHEMIEFFVTNRNRLIEMGKASFRIQEEYSSEKVAQRIFEKLKAEHTES